MKIHIKRVWNPNCWFCKGKGEYRRIVDHDDCGAVWEDTICDCGYNQVFVDDNLLEPLLISLGYKDELPKNNLQ